MIWGNVLISAAVIVAAGSGWGCSDKGGSGEGFSMPPMPVEVVNARIQSVSDRFEAVGTIEAIEAVTVVSEIDAAVMSFSFEEGGYIRRGEDIAHLDDTQLAAEVARAEALQTQSKVNFGRTKSIVDQKAGSQQDLDDAAAGLKVSEANLSVARARFAKTRIVAPFDGVIGARKVSVGTFLRAGQPIVELANIDEIRVTFFSPERFLPQLKRGAQVTISTAAYPGHDVTGTILAIEPVLDPVTRSAKIVARVANPDRKFRPGMSANVSTVLNKRDNAIVIPSEAVFASGNSSHVFIVKPDSTVTKATITLGTRLSDVVEVLSGLDGGAMVVRAGHQKLFEGARVMPVPGRDSVEAR